MPTFRSVRTRTGITVVAVSALAIVACDRSEDGEQSAALQVQLELQTTDGVESNPFDAILGSVSAAAIDDEGRVFVVDERSSALVAFGSEGEVLWRTDARGDGPGELFRPTGVAVDGSGGLYVVNANRTKLELWSTAGQYKRTVGLQALGFRGTEIEGFAAPGKAVMSGYVMGEFAVNLALLDVREGDVEFEFAVRATPTTNAISTGLAERLDVGVSGQTITIGNLGAYVLRAYDRHGRLVDTVSIDDGHELAVPGTYDDGRVRVILRLGGVSAPLSVGEGAWLSMAVWSTTVADPDEAARRMALAGEPPPKPVWAARLDVFDHSWRHQATTPLDHEDIVEMGQPVAAHDGALFTIVDYPFPHVRKYAVTLRDVSR